MQIGVYGSGYLATVISACLADFGTPVCCCHADGTRIMEVAKGNIPFFEKNLQEVIRRNVRSGRLIYSVDPEELARRAQVIFLAEDSAQGLEELVVRLAGAAGRFQVLSIVTPVRVGSSTKIEKMLKEKGLKSLLVCQPMFFTNGCSGHELRNSGVDARSDHCISGNQDFVHQRNCEPVRACKCRRRQLGARHGAGQENRAALPATRRGHGWNFRRD